MDTYQSNSFEISNKYMIYGNFSLFLLYNKFNIYFANCH